MSWLEAIILGIVQGLTEFLPISSSAHVYIVGQAFGQDPGAAFTAVMQIGTEVAVVIYFRKDIWRILSHWCLALVGKLPRNDPEARIGWYIILGSIPIGVLGIVLKSFIENQFRNLWITVTMLIVVGIVLGVADQVAARRQNSRTMEDLTIKDGLIFGFAQALALVPGVSRSGATVSAGLFLGFTREAAARYSFLLAIPAVFASGLFELRSALDEPHIEWAQIIVATVVAFIVGYLVIAWLMRYITTNNFAPFVIYRIALGTGIAILLLTGVLPATASG